MRQACLLFQNDSHDNKSVKLLHWHVVLSQDRNTVKVVCWLSFSFHDRLQAVTKPTSCSTGNNLETQTNFICGSLVIKWPVIHKERICLLNLWQTVHLQAKVEEMWVLKGRKFPLQNRNLLPRKMDLLWKIQFYCLYFCPGTPYSQRQQNKTSEVTGNR